MKRFVKRMSSIALTFLLLLISILPMTVFADDYQDSDPNDMITEVFNTDIEAGADNCYHVKEKIVVDFVKSHHGIYRYIPDSYNYAIENISVDSGQHYETDYEDGNTIIQIGDESAKIKGKHTYVISYDLSYYRDDNTEQDVLNLDLLPTGWDTSIRESTIHLSLPYEIDWSKVQLYYGEYGSEDSAGDNIQCSAEGTELNIYATGLQKGYGITAYTELEENYWNKATYYYERHPGANKFFLILSALSMLLAAGFWILYGRDKDRMYQPVMVRPPRGLTPLEVGCYYNNGASNRDVISMLFYFANKGYLKIQQTEAAGKAFSKDAKKEFRLIKGTAADPSEKEFVRNMLRRVFDLIRDDSVSLDTFNERFQEADENFISRAQSEVSSSLEIQNKGQNTLLRFLILILTMFTIFFSGFIAGPDYWVFTMMIAPVWALAAFFSMRFIDRKKKSGLVLGLILGLIAEAVMYFVMSDIGGMYLVMMMLLIPVTLVFLALMQSPSEEYQKLMGEIYGFRNYIKKVDEQRLRVQLAESPDYFYDILPYAIVFDLESRWSRQFTDLGLEPSSPSWYDSAAPFVYSAMWTDHLVQSFNDSVHIDVDTGSDGGGSFGGGGAGGGGGGGGGGGW